MDTESDKDFLEQSVPVLFRGAEQYIDPSQKYGKIDIIVVCLERVVHERTLAIII